MAFPQLVWILFSGDTLILYIWKEFVQNHCYRCLFASVKGPFKNKSDRDDHFLSDDKFSTRNTVLKGSVVENTICNIPSQAIFQSLWVWWGLVMVRSHCELLGLPPLDNGELLLGDHWCTGGLCVMLLVSSGIASLLKAWSFSPHGASRELHSSREWEDWA